MTTNLTRRLRKGVWATFNSTTHTQPRVPVTESHTHGQHTQTTHTITCAHVFSELFESLTDTALIITLCVCEVRSYNRYHNKLLLRAEIWEECPCHKLLSNHLNSENQKEKETWFNIWFRAHTIPRPESKQHQIWQQIRADRENAERNYVCNKNRVSCYLPSVFFFPHFF